MSADVILLGLGVMGKAWLQALSAEPRARVAACVEPHRETREALIASGRLPRELVFSSFEETADIRADMALVVVPPDAHEACCVQAAERGLHILCEKPLAPTLEAARRIVAAADRAGVMISVAQNRRHSPFIHGLRSLVRTGEYGPPGQVFVTFRHIFTRDSFRDTMPHPLLVDMSNHHFDTIRYVLGQEPAGVQAIEWNPPWSRFAGNGSAVALFDYESGLRVCYQGTWHTIDIARTSNGCTWRVECPGGVYVCEDERLYKGPLGGTLAPADLPDMPLCGQAYLLDEFLTAMRNGKAPQTSGRDNLGTLSMVFGAVRSAEGGGRVALT